MEEAAAAVNDVDDGSVVNVFITRVVPELVKSTVEPERIEGDLVAVIKVDGDVIVAWEGEFVDADADVKDDELPSPDVVLTVPEFPTVIVEGLGIVAVSVPWVIGKEFGIPAQTS